MLDSVELDVGLSESKGDCGTQWYQATLTHYTSYPDPNDYEECVLYSGCKYQGQFYGLGGPAKSEEWVKNNNIIAIHAKDWGWLGLKNIRIRQGEKEIIATAYDLCSDSDCAGCCSNNLGDNDFLIDIEKYTKQRFGSGSGTVSFQVCY